MLTLLLLLLVGALVLLVFFGSSLAPLAGYAVLFAIAGLLMVAIALVIARI